MIMFVLSCASVAVCVLYCMHAYFMPPSYGMELMYRKYLSDVLFTVTVIVIVLVNTIHH